MGTVVLPSTLLLTLLLAIGLFFFIRASTKERLQSRDFVGEQDETTLMNQLQEYFQVRSYRVAAVDQEENQVTFEGFVQPSWFLAIFLSILTAIGLLCLSLVLSLLFPSLLQLFLGIIVLSPVSGIFYWKKAGKLEKVLLKLSPNTNQSESSKITVIAHRDELIALQRALQLKQI
ncbi:MAG: cofactor assembly of complex C subunit B [Calothrix sp. MO_167.B12]|nr:cofactor assembly of complex C subunit B [Calothrix sp. MO_167.B12]